MEVSRGHCGVTADSGVFRVYAGRAVSAPMKLHLVLADLTNLTLGQRQRMRDDWTPAVGDWFAHYYVVAGKALADEHLCLGVESRHGGQRLICDYDGEGAGHSVCVGDCLPLWSIGQLVGLLMPRLREGDAIRLCGDGSVWVDDNAGEHGCVKAMRSGESIDALFSIYLSNLLEVCHA